MAIDDVLPEGGVLEVAQVGHSAPHARLVPVPRVSELREDAFTGSQGKHSCVCVCVCVCVHSAVG